MALKKELIDNNGVSTTYHKINSLKFDYTTDKCIIEIANYTDKSFRDAEKNAVKEYEEKKERYYELNNKYHNNNITDEELREFASTDISLIENMKLGFEGRNVSTTEMEIDFNVELRNSLYDLLKSKGILQDGIDI